MRSHLENPSLRATEGSAAICLYSFIHSNRKDPHPYPSPRRGQEQNNALQPASVAICLFFRHCERSAAICLYSFIHSNPQHPHPSPSPFAPNEGAGEGKKRVPPHNIGCASHSLITLSWDCLRAGGSGKGRSPAEGGTARVPEAQAGSYSTNVARLHQERSEWVGFSNAQFTAYLSFNQRKSVFGVWGLRRGTLSAPCSPFPEKCQGGLLKKGRSNANTLSFYPGMSRRTMPVSTINLIKDFGGK